MSDIKINKTCVKGGSKRRRKIKGNNRTKHINPKRKSLFYKYRKTVSKKK